MHASAQLSLLIAQLRTGSIPLAARGHARCHAAATAADSGPPPAPAAAPAPATLPSGPARHRFVDIGANMLDSMFEGDYRGKRAHPPDVDAVLARAADAGVERLIVTAGSLEESRKALDFVRARRAAGSRVALFSTVGVHPTRALEFLPEGERAEVEAAMQKVAAAEKGVPSGSEPAPAAAAAAAELAAVVAAVLARDSVAPAVAAHCAALEAVLQEGRDEGIVVAVGECGLDYDRLFFCPAGVQRRGFEAQLTLALRAGLPLFLHNRNTGDAFAALCAARKDALAPGGASRRKRGQRPCRAVGGRGESGAALSEASQAARHARRARPRSPAPCPAGQARPARPCHPGGVVHSFDGDAAELDALLGLGLHIGVNGCSLRTADNLAVAAAVPAERLHLETDAPWCGIKRTHAGRRAWPRPGRGAAKTWGRWTGRTS